VRGGALRISAFLVRQPLSFHVPVTAESSASTQPSTPRAFTFSVTTCVISHFFLHICDGWRAEFPSCCHIAMFLACHLFY